MGHPGRQRAPGNRANQCPRRSASTRLAHAAGTPDRDAGRGRPDQQRDRPTAFPVTSDRRSPPVPDLPQTRHNHPGSAARRARIPAPRAPQRESQLAGTSKNRLSGPGDPRDDTAAAADHRRRSRRTPPGSCVLNRILRAAGPQHAWRVRNKTGSPRRFPTTSILAWVDRDPARRAGYLGAAFKTLADQGAQLRSRMIRARPPPRPTRLPSTRFRQGGPCPQNV